MSKSVVIYGGGVAGAVLATQLAKHAKVQLVSPLDYFEVPMAMPRVAVQSDYAHQAVIPFHSFLTGVDFIHGKLERFTGETGHVVSTDGTERAIQADISILATGSRYPSDLIRPIEGSTKERHAMFKSTHGAIEAAQKILLVGGGPVGIELAGEISESFPGKSVTLVESSSEVLKGTSRKTANHAVKVLQQRGVKFMLGERVLSPEPSSSQKAEAGQAKLSSGAVVEYDLIIWCIGGKPNTDYMQQDLAHLLDARGYIAVEETFQMKGKINVFALGDVAGIDEVKKALYVRGHVKTVAHNVQQLLKNPQAKLKSYKPKTNDTMMLVTLGSEGGVADIPPVGTVKANWFARMAKAKTMLVPMCRKALGASAKA
ncbi:NADH dehydrogenase, FAD-containing subunit [Pseudovibrio denitrificans]|uniref:NADH dehydrogenase, FAD-containing subunit n=1 Tax=Pseudovibrio denitrificans TaxID=258256 RepID=A0A1I7D069_9HYPH|nr:FAD-dependent oxidoreductase [Pseudovibrio denitrificans]SFU05095.1 NADH dehydrogenase, FAD-containing subunit [Pseudovibrio denitrificans]